MDNFMVDIETTGLDPNRNAITSIAVVPFSPNYAAIDHQRAIHVALHHKADRHDDANTMAWRKTNLVDAREAKLEKMEFEQFAILLSKLINSIAENSPVIWCKPLGFDDAFLKSYYWRYSNEAHSIVYPFHYQNLMDVRSYIAGCGFSKDDNIVYPPITNAHDALADAVAQCQSVIRAKRMAVERQSTAI